MIVEYEKTIKISNEEIEIIREGAKVLDYLNYILHDDEALCIDGSYYSKELVRRVFDFLCDLRMHDTLTIHGEEELK